MIPLVLLLGIQIGPAAKEAPNRQPQLASRETNVGVTYGAGNAVYFAASLDSGTTFGPPVLVSAKGQLSLGMHRGPRVAYTARGIVISAIVGEQGKGRDGDLLAWTSRDGGQSWSEPVRVNDVPASAREGLHAMAFGGNDTLFAAWLDLRRKGTQVYGAISKDGGATWSGNRLVYGSPSGTVCQCCHPSVAVDASGAIFVMFRNAWEGSRDLYLSRSADGGKSFDEGRKLGVGTWKLEACPMDGGGLAVDQKGRATTIWRREEMLFETDGDGPERTLGLGRNPTAVVTQTGVYAAWTQGRAVLVRKPGTAQPEIVSEDGGFPSSVALPDGSVMMAWESNGSIVIRRVR